MAQINVSNLTFCYDGSYDNIFENASFQIDTDWKLGFIGRNGRGKTTFLNLLLGKYEYKGEISSPVSFDYFPAQVEDEQLQTIKVIKNLIAPFDEIENKMNEYARINTPESMEKYGELYEQFLSLDGYMIEELIEKELSKLDVTTEVLNRPFYTLSNGEKTKALLIGLFLKTNNFLLIDEPTNHLDLEGRKAVANYLKSKKSFILVSHDRRFLGDIIDHVLAINRANIEVQRGNYDTWKQNKTLQDNFELAENVKLKKDIARLSEAAARTEKWSDKVEVSKIGQHIYDRGFVGRKAADMMKRSKSIVRRREEASDAKTQLLKNVELTDDLKLNFLSHHANPYMEAFDVSIHYGSNTVVSGVNFKLHKNDRLSILGANGSGKSSIIKLLLGEPIEYSGKYYVASGLKISYVSQDTSLLMGNLKQFAVQCQIDESLFKAILRKMGFSRIQFEKSMEEFSQGQKKKVLIAKSLSEQAHIYIWDEPLNYVDIISRIQIENLIKTYEPTMIFVEHDMVFNEAISTKTIQL